MPQTTKRTLDLLRESFDLSKRRKFDVLDDEGKLVTSLYFKPITRAIRAKATKIAGGDDPLVLSTQILCQMAENEDGSKAFDQSDADMLQAFIPENVLNEIELFLFNVNPAATLSNVKES